VKDSAKYAKVVEWSDEDQCYVGSAPGLIYGGCHGHDERAVFSELCDIVDEVIEALKREGMLEEVGGPIYLRDLVDQVPTPASAAHYATIVSKSALRRRLISAAADIMEMAYGATDDAETVADDAEQRIYDVARRDERDEVAILRELVDKAMFDLESIQNRDSAFTGLPTGFRDLDTLTSGLQPGNLIVIAARPGVGKS